MFNTYSRHKLVINDYRIYKSDYHFQGALAGETKRRGFQILCDTQRG